MSDLISREALKEELKKALDFASATAYIRKLNSLEKTDLVKLALNIIDNAPVVDNIEKGYCDTCKHNGGYPSAEICIGCKDFNRYKKGDVV